MSRFPRVAEALVAFSGRRRRQRARIAELMVHGMSRRARMQKVLFGCAAPTQSAARNNGGHGPISILAFEHSANR